MSSNNEPVLYTNWYTDEPNNLGTENCVEMYWIMKWNDIPCNHQAYSVCQKVSDDEIVQEISKEQCQYNWIGDGYCDDETNLAKCQFDGGDCCQRDRLTHFCTDCLCYDSDDGHTVSQPLFDCNRCVFPFTYSGVTYDSCTDAEFYTLWCATDVTTEDEVTNGGWAICKNTNCKSPTPLVSSAGNISVLSKTEY
jgi:hypothetical protein